MVGEVGVLVERGIFVTVNWGGALLCGSTSSVLRRPVVKIKSNKPRYSATRIESEITSIVYTIVCRRVGQATYRSSPFVSLRYWKNPMLEVVNECELCEYEFTNSYTQHHFGIRTHIHMARLCWDGLNDIWQSSNSCGMPKWCWVKENIVALLLVFY